MVISTPPLTSNIPISNYTSIKGYCSEILGCKKESDVIVNSSAFETSQLTIPPFLQLPLFIYQVLYSLFLDHPGVAILQAPYIHYQPYTIFPYQKLSPSLVTKPISNALHLHAIEPPKPPMTPTPTPLITTDYPGLPKLKLIHKEGFHILSLETITHNLLKKCPTVNFCWPPNFHQILSNILLHPRPPTTSKGFLSCNRTCCKAFPTQSFTSHKTNLSYLITTLIDWYTNSNVQNRIPFTLAKWIRCSQNVWMGTGPHVRSWTLTY